VAAVGMPVLVDMGLCRAMAWEARKMKDIESIRKTRPFCAGLDAVATPVLIPEINSTRPPSASCGFPITAITRDHGDPCPSQFNPETKGLSAFNPGPTPEMKRAIPAMIRLNPRVGPGLPIDKLNSLQTNDLAYNNHRQKSSEK